MKKMACLLLGFAVMFGACACGAGSGGDGGNGGEDEVAKVEPDGTVTESTDGYVYKNESIALSVTKTGIISSIIAGGRTVVQDDNLQAKIYYSTASDMWSAKSFSEKLASHATVTDQKDRIVIKFESFDGVSVNVSTEILLKNENIYFNNTVESAADGTVVAVEAPYLQGLNEIENGKFYIPDRNGGVVDDALGANNSTSEQSYRYPVIMSAQLYSYGSDEHTVSIRVEDKKMAYKEFQFGGKNNAMSVRQYPFLGKGKTAKLSSVVIKCADDSWHSASDDYGAWYHSWAKSPKKSGKLSNFPIIGETTVNWKPLDENSQPESLTSIVSKFSLLKGRGYSGSELVTWWGGPDNPPTSVPEWQDLVYPDYRYPSTIGDKDGLAEFIDRIHALGDMQIGFYTNARLGSQNSSLLNSDWKVKVSNCEYYADYETWWNNTYNIMCPSTDFLTLTLARQSEFAEAGVDFMQIDQIGAAPSFLCFGKEHGHTTPATAWAEGYCSYLEKVSALTDKYDTWFWTEGTWEGSSQYVQVSQYGAWGVDNQDVRNSRHFPAFYLYTFKTHKLFGGAWLGGVPIWTVAPGSADATILQDNAEFYAASEYRDDYGLTYNRAEGSAVWHKNGDQLMLLARGNGEAASSTFVVKLAKTLIGKKDVESFLAQGNLTNINVTESDDEIMLTLTLRGTEIGGALIKLI